MIIQSLYRTTKRNTDLQPATKAIPTLALSNEPVNIARYRPPASLILRDQSAHNQT